MEWVAFPFSRGCSQTRDQIQVSHIAGGFFASWATREALVMVGHCFDGDGDDGKDENEDGGAGKTGHKPAIIHLHSPTE